MARPRKVTGVLKGKPVHDAHDRPGVGAAGLRAKDDEEVLCARDGHVHELGVRVDEARVRRPFPVGCGEEDHGQLGSLQAVGGAHGDAGEPLVELAQPPSYEPRLRAEGRHHAHDLLDGLLVDLLQRGSLARNPLRDGQGLGGVAPARACPTVLAPGDEPEEERALGLNLNLPRFRLHPYAAFRRRSSSGRLARSNSSGLRYPSAEWVLALL